MTDKRGEMKEDWRIINKSGINNKCVSGINNDSWLALKKVRPLIVTLVPLLIIYSETCNK